MAIAGDRAMDRAYNHRWRRRAPLSAVGVVGRLHAVRADRRSSRGRAVHDRDAAAERHRRAAPRLGDVRDTAGHDDPLAPHAGRPDALAAGHRPRRHRDADRGRARAGATRARRRHDLGREEFVERVWEWKEQYGARITRPAAAAWAPRCDWTRERFTMDAGLVARRARGVRAALREGPDLPRRAHHQLVPALPDRALRPRGRARGGRRASSGTSATRSTDGRTSESSSSRRRGPRRCSATRPWPCTPTTRATRDLHRAARRCCRSSAARSRSSPTTAVEPEFGTGAVKVTPGARPERLRDRPAPQPAAAINVIEPGRAR